MDLPYPVGRQPERIRGTPASVLMLWGFSELQADHPHLLLTKRSETVDTHQGQMAFPGGVQEPSDDSSVVTALRESAEEVGVDPSKVEVFGALPELLTVTGFRVTPVIGLLKSSIESHSLVINQAEIAESLWVSYFELRSSYRQEWVTYQKALYPTDVFLKEPHRVWGVTGALLKNLLDRFQTLG
jgi:8-oxo-dGTP pyrophosphatase MutT (NUDIX family)